MIDWESDAELKALRQEFVDSLPEKLNELKRVIDADEKLEDRALSELLVLAHRHVRRLNPLCQRGQDDTVDAGDYR